MGDVIKLIPQLLGLVIEMEIVNLIIFFIGLALCIAIWKLPAIMKELRLKSERGDEND